MLVYYSPWLERLHCDSEGCKEVGPFYGISGDYLSIARYSAALYGWQSRSSRGGTVRDYCPSHHRRTTDSATNEQGERAMREDDDQ